MNLSPKAQQILSRYMAGYITDAQLLQYKNLNVISQEEYEYIYAQKHPEAEEE